MSLTHACAKGNHAACGSVSHMDPLHCLLTPCCCPPCSCTCHAPAAKKQWKVYLASSWRNPLLDELVRLLTAAKFTVYDFRAQPGNFNWATVLDKDPMRLTQYQVLQALRGQEAASQFELDHHALLKCDVMLLVLPSGRSAHLEAGYFAGLGKPVFTLFAPNDGIDLMHMLLGDESRWCTSALDAVAALDTYRKVVQ